MKMSEKKLTTIQNKDLANYIRTLILQKSSDCLSKKVLDKDVGNILDNNFEVCDLIKNLSSSYEELVGKN